VKTARIRGRPKSCGAGRESEGLIVLRKAVRSRWREGALLWLGWNVVVDADIRGYFDNIDQAKLILQDGKLGCQIQSGGQLCMEPGNPLAVAARRTAYALSLRPLAVPAAVGYGPVSPARCREIPDECHVKKTHR
jgi:hypothetical protein